LKDSVKTFRGRNVAEAMQKVRAELGSDAYVLEKRELKGKKSLFKLGGDEMVEITATNSAEVAKRIESNKPRAPKGRTLLEKTYDTSSATGLNCVIPDADNNVQVELNSHRRNIPASSEQRTAPATKSLSQINPAAADGISTGAAAGVGGADFNAIMETMRSEILRMTSIQARGGFPAVGERLLDSYQMLVENEVNSTIARTLVEDQQRELGQGSLDAAIVSDSLCRAVSEMIRTAPASDLERKVDGPRVISVVGPSGAGKTTTVVKMAFHFALNHKKKVGIINEDFRRPGASAQLQGLMSILDLPLVTADSTINLANELRNMNDLDVVLIDTAGRGPRDSKGLTELHDYLTVARPDEVHLAINAASTERSAMACVRAFEECGFDRIILSKLDEAPAYGLALNIASTVAQEISYLTTGQKWSAGLEAADSDMLARLICGVDAPL